MKWITVVLVAGIGIALAVGSFICVKAAGGAGFTNLVMSNDSVWHGKVREYTLEEDVPFEGEVRMDGLSETPLPGFSRFTRIFRRSFRHKEFDGECKCSFRMDYPDPTIPQAAAIRRWLVTFVSENEMQALPYLGDANDSEAQARYFANRFFKFTENDFVEEEHELDMRVYELNDRYVTYWQYTYLYWGGAHGFNTERLVSLDLQTRKNITAEYLFKKDCMQKVRELLMATAFEDKHFRECHEDVKTIEDVIRYFMPETMTMSNIIASLDSSYVQPNVRLDRVDISRVGLTSKGVVFSYYPYELSCFADGCFHFTIPYSKLRPYLRMVVPEY